MANNTNTQSYSLKKIHGCSASEDTITRYISIYLNVSVGLVSVYKKTI